MNFRILHTSLRLCPISLPVYLCHQVMRCVQLLAILTITVSGIRLHKKHSLHENLEWTSEDGRSFLELATEAFHQKLDQRVRSTHEAEVTANAEIKHEAKHEALHEALHEARQMLGPLGAFRTVVRGGG